MKIGIIGATGMTGQAVYREAVERGHEVTAIVRDATRAQAKLGASVTTLEKDAFALETADLTGFDVVVDAFANHQAPDQNLDMVTHLVHALRNEAKPRLAVVLGAGSLIKEDGGYHYDFLKTLPETAAWINEPRFSVTELQVLESTDNVDWTAITAQDEYSEGPKGAYKIGTNQLMFAADDQSHVTSGNLAAALLDELETPKFKQARFTVSDK